VVFDVEAMFLFPWAVVLKEIGLVGYVEMFVFM
ncbi:MAG: NADH-quinone oxidoreductase subunit A, partial [Mesorhizobium sp.]